MTAAGAPGALGTRSAFAALMIPRSTRSGRAAPVAVRIDPTGEELQSLLSFAGDLNGKRVLEIGCGDGRLTRKYAALASYVVAFDPDPDEIEQAIRDLPAELAARVSFETHNVLDFPIGERFDLAVLSWSL